MKLFIIFLFALIALGQCDYEEDWSAFKMKYEKFYTEAEEPSRFEIYKANRELAKVMDSKAPNTQFGETKFSDLSPEEFRETVRIAHWFPMLT